MTSFLVRTFETPLGPGRQVDADFGAGAKSCHPSIHEGMGTTGAAEVLAFRAVGRRVIPWREFQSRLATPGIEGRRALVHGDPPLFFGAHLLFAANVTCKTFDPSHRVLCHPV